MPDEEREVMLELEAQEIQLLVDEVTELSEQVLDQPAHASPFLARPGRTTQHQRLPPATAAGIERALRETRRRPRGPGRSTVSAP